MPMRCGEVLARGGRDETEGEREDRAGAGKEDRAGVGKRNGKQERGSLREIGVGSSDSFGATSAA